jgi:2-phosphosulfolactate phosphatase
MAEQTRRGARTSIAVIAAGELPHPGAAAGELPHPVPTGAPPTGALRFAVEDQLGAGAVIDALGKLGIDHTSPEAAAACESFRGLRGAMRHLLTASGSGRELAEEGRRADVLHAAEQDAVAAVPRLTDGVFAA